MGAEVEEEVRGSLDPSSFILSLTVSVCMRGDSSYVKLCNTMNY